MKKLITIGGIYNILFALFHAGFWKMFNWSTELEKLSFNNKWVMQILNVHIIYYLIFTAVICFVFKKELLTTKIGKGFLIGSAGFWFIRAMEQFVYWELSAVSTIIMVLFFLLGAALFLIPAFYKNR
ncbi:MAG: hypothetical protein LBV72_15790 [Tannerella sp.]|jgi:hypothetical protein|nr:hypothetical protein [Tannerella sp.]